MSKIQTPKFPLVAELKDLSKCLNRVGERPLKLIADKVYKKFNETEWDVPKWSFASDNGIIQDKKLLSNVDDTFQFSIANGQSKQDFHAHRKISVKTSWVLLKLIYICIEHPIIIVAVCLYGFTFFFLFLSFRELFAPQAC